MASNINQSLVIRKIGDYHCKESQHWHNHMGMMCELNLDDPLLCMGNQNCAHTISSSSVKCVVNGLLTLLHVSQQLEFVTCNYIECVVLCYPQQHRLYTRSSCNCRGIAYCNGAKALLHLLHNRSCT